MRKKTIVWAYLILISLGTILSLYIPKNEVAAKDAIVIPGQAIRLRILANSDLESDQALKRKVRDAVNAKISVWVKDLTSIKEARTVIKSKLPEIQATAEEVVTEEGSKQKVKVKFGKVQFPTKLYGQFLYPAGDYEAILITLGAGKGANWWCVLFPPLCFLDFSNGLAVSKGFEDQKQPVKEAPVKAKAELQTDIKPVEKKVSKPQANTDAKSEVSKQETDSKSEVSKQESDSKSEVSKQGTDSEPEVTVITKKAAKVAAANVKHEVVNRVEKEMQQEETLPDTEEISPAKQEAPVYTSQDEEPVIVKFFVVELWNKIF